MGSTGTASPVLLRVALDDPRSLAALAGSVPILVAAFDGGAEFLRAYSDRGPAGELALRTRAAPRADTAIILEVAWPGLPNRVFVRAHVKRRLFGRLVVRLDPDEEAKRDFLLRMARNRPTSIAVRMHRRFCVRLPLEWRRFGGRELLAGVAEDISAGGVLVGGTRERVSIGDRVAVRLRTQREQDLVLTGRVRHVTTRQDESRAFGVQFEYRSSGEQRALRTLLRVFAAKGVVLVDPSL